MNIGTAVQMAQQIKRAGIDTSPRMKCAGVYSVVAMDVVSCSSGSRHWTELRELVLHTERECVRYILDIS